MREKFDETSTVEREHKLWKASQEYINGKIDLDELEKVEYPYMEVFKKAALTSSKIQPLKNFSSIILLFAIIMIIISSFFIYLYTNDQLILIYLLSLAILFSD